MDKNVIFHFMYLHNFLKEDVILQKKIRNVFLSKYGKKLMDGQISKIRFYAIIDTKLKNPYNIDTKLKKSYTNKRRNHELSHQPQTRDNNF